MPRLALTFKRQNPSNSGSLNNCDRANELGLEAAVVLQQDLPTMWPVPGASLSPFESGCLERLLGAERHRDRGYRLNHAI